MLYAAGAAGLTALAFLARHERKLIRARRGLVLEPVRDLFTSATYSTDGAGIPQLEGVYRGHHLKLDLIPDTMTMRRLPQLWLSVTLQQVLPIDDTGVAILVRPSGADFYSLTEHMHEHFDPPGSIPWETLIRGQSAASARTLSCIAPAAARLLDDAKVKEIAVTHRGARIVYQLAEGGRGQHLLLRQCDFHEARIERDLLDRLIDGLEAIVAALAPLH